MERTVTAEPQALVVIDVQEGFDDDYWGPSANEQAEENIAALLEEWSRRDRGPIIVVRHDSAHPASPLHPSRRGNQVKGFIDLERVDVVVSKRVNSAFLGDPDLHLWLGHAGIRRLVLCGIQTNMCVETTARMGGNLGYDVTVVLDATRTFDLAAMVPGVGESHLSASELMRATAINLQAGGFADVVSTTDLLRGLALPGGLSPR